MKKTRDNFTGKTVLRLAQRVGYQCSFPRCSRATVGPVVSDTSGVTVVGRACHIEAASVGGPRYNPGMTAEQRKSIDNGIWCCAFHADIIDNDLNSFSVSTLREWKKIAEAFAYSKIDTSSTKTVYPETLVQLGDGIVFGAVWSDLNIENRTADFRLTSFVYGNWDALESFVRGFDTFARTKKYFVVESNGYGRLLSERPELLEISDKKIIKVTFEERTEYTSPDHFFDIPLSIGEEGIDIQVSELDDNIVTVEGFITGKPAVVQSIQMLLASNRGEWALDPEMGSYLFRYYRDHHMDHELLARLIKLEISRMTSVPELDVTAKSEPHIPVSSINWVESVVLRGHSDNLLEVIVKLHFTDNTYYENVVSIPASFKERTRD